MRTTACVIIVCDTAAWGDAERGGSAVGSAHQGTGGVDSCITGIYAGKPFWLAKLPETLL